MVYYLFLVGAKAYGTDFTRWRYNINPKTVTKWRKRTSQIEDLPTSPKQARSTVFSIEEQAIIVALRKHTLLPLDDCLYALQETIPHLTRSSLHPYIS